MTRYRHRPRTGLAIVAGGGVKCPQFSVCGLPDAGVFGTPTSPSRERIGATSCGSKAAQTGGYIMSIDQCDSLDRRDLLCGGGAAMFSAIVATLIGGAR